MSIPVSEGVVKEVLRPGNGAQVQKGNTITVHCTGSLADPPKKFWSTKDAGQKPFTFKCGVGQVIAGWDEGCLSMKHGEISKLTIQGHKGYGPRGFPAWGITPNATLIFEIEILSIQWRMEKTSAYSILYHSFIEKNAIGLLLYGMLCYVLAILYFQRFSWNLVYTYGQLWDFSRF